MDRLGGHLNMENFITGMLVKIGPSCDQSRKFALYVGYPGHESGMRKALLKVLGQEKYDFFFEKVGFYSYLSGRALRII
jgi:hypothetical protein